MSLNQAWQTWGWTSGGDLRMRPLPTLNGGVRRAIWERIAWSQKGHTAVYQSSILHGDVSSGNYTTSEMLDMGQSDFMDFIDTLPQTLVWWGGRMDLARWLSTNFVGEVRAVVNSDGTTSKLAFMLDQLSSGYDTDRVSAQFLVDQDIVRVDGEGRLYVPTIPWMPPHEAYAYVRRTLDAYRWVRSSICPWMVSVDATASTCTASSALLAICPAGRWKDGNELWPLTAAVPLADSRRETLALWLDGRDFLKFQEDEDD